MPVSNPPGKRTLVSWSSGKDSAWTLHNLAQQDDVEIVALLSTINGEFDRVAMHGVRTTLLDAQSHSLGFPLVQVPLPWPCSNDVYEKAIERTITHFINDIPHSVDPCGERGEFHTFVFDGPMFSNKIVIKAGETINRNGCMCSDPCANVYAGFRHRSTQPTKNNDR